MIIKHFVTPKTVAALSRSIAPAMVMNHLVTGLYSLYGNIKVNHLPFLCTTSYFVIETRNTLDFDS